MNPATLVPPRRFQGAGTSRDLTNGLASSAADNRSLLDALQESGVKTVVFHQDWAEYYGEVAPWGGQRLRRLIRECHKRDLKLLLYVGYGLARNAPELQGHHDEWSVLPLIPWTTPHRTEFEAFDATCARSGWADWLVAGH